MTLKNFPEGTVVPKTAMSAGNCFVQSKKGQGLKLQEIQAMWGKLNEKQKQPFVKQAELDQQRYINELSSLQLNGFFINGDGVRSTDMKPKKAGIQKNGATDEALPIVQPKPTKSAYSFFIQVNLKTFKESNSLSNTETMKFAATQWSKLSAKMKKKYETMHEKDKARHHNQLTMLETQGFFVMDDGSKSTDEANVKILQKKNDSKRTKSPEPSKKQKK
jgi:hypothetical protein